jgi:hypothetical protein
VDNYANIKGIGVILFASALPKASLFNMLRKGLAAHKHK